MKDSALTPWDHCKTISFYVMTILLDALSILLQQNPARNSGERVIAILSGLGVTVTRPCAIAELQKIFQLPFSVSYVGFVNEPSSFHAARPYGAEKRLVRLITSRALSCSERDRGVGLLPKRRVLLSAEN